MKKLVSSLPYTGTAIVGLFGMGLSITGRIPLATTTGEIFTFALAFAMTVIGTYGAYVTLTEKSENI